MGRRADRRRNVRYDAPYAIKTELIETTSEKFDDWNRTAQAFDASLGPGPKVSVVLGVLRIQSVGAEEDAIFELGSEVVESGHGRRVRRAHRADRTSVRHRQARQREQDARHGPAPETVRATMRAHEDFDERVNARTRSSRGTVYGMARPLSSSGRKSGSFRKGGGRASVGGGGSVARGPKGGGMRLGARGPREAGLWGRSGTIPCGGRVFSAPSRTALRGRSPKRRNRIGTQKRRKKRGTLSRTAPAFVRSIEEGQNAFSPPPPPRPAAAPARGAVF